MGNGGRATGPRRPRPERVAPLCRRRAGGGHGLLALHATAPGGIGATVGLAVHREVDLLVEEAEQVLDGGAVVERVRVVPDDVLDHLSVRELDGVVVGLTLVA